MQLSQFNVQTINSAVLTTDTSVTAYPINWHPDFWIVVSRLTAGYIWIYPSAQRGPLRFRIDRGSVRLPVNTDTLTIETVGATGFYDVYAVHHLDGLDIEA